MVAGKSEVELNKLSDTVVVDSGSSTAVCVSTLCSSASEAIFWPKSKFVDA